MYGVVEGLMRCQQARTEDLNKRVRRRTFPSQILQSTFSPRPVPTRYVKMPAIDCKKKANVFIKKHPTYSSYNVFNPGNAQAPWSGWATAIDQDSRLKNIFFPNQECPQTNYVPSSNSQLYVYQVISKEEIEQKHKSLFKEAKVFNKNVNKKFKKFNGRQNIGKKTFNNYTRVQVKNLTL